MSQHGEMFGLAQLAVKQSEEPYKNVLLVPFFARQGAADASNEEGAACLVKGL